MTDGDLTVRKLLEVFLIENLADHTEFLYGGELLIIIDRDARADVSPVLEAVKRVVSY